MLLSFAFVLNLALYIFFKPVIYNGIRHYLFLVPIISAIALITFVEILTASPIKVAKTINLQTLVAVLVGTGMLAQLAGMVKLHPYEYLYFNEIVGGVKGAQNNYELDYWGATYKEAVEWLRKNKTADLPKVYPCNLAYGVQYYAHGMLKVVNSSAKADYTICDYDNDKLLEQKGVVINKVGRFGVPLSIIRKLPPQK